MRAVHQSLTHPPHLTLGTGDFINMVFEPTKSCGTPGTAVVIAHSHCDYGDRFLGSSAGFT